MCEREYSPIYPACPFTLKAPHGGASHQAGRMSSPSILLWGAKNPRQSSLADQLRSTLHLVVGCLVTAAGNHKLNSLPRDESPELCRRGISANLFSGATWAKARADLISHHRALRHYQYNSTAAAAAVVMTVFLSRQCCHRAPPPARFVANKEKWSVQWLLVVAICRPARDLKV